MRILLAAFLILAVAPARADVSDARAHYEKATAAYALGNYSEAAEEYEKAFALKPDSALLYNAAQAHRIAGHKHRALLLYQNYVRIFGDKVRNLDEVQRHIAALKKAIATDEQTAGAPPTTPQQMAPGGKGEPTPTPTPTPPPQTKPEPTPAPAAAVSTTPPPPEKKPIYKKAWFWGVIGGVAAAVVIGVGLGVGLGSSTKDPTASIATVQGN
jgi:tetratricopeptide (TPR) repeat protein